MCKLNLFSENQTGHLFLFTYGKKKNPELREKSGCLVYDFGNKTFDIYMDLCRRASCLTIVGGEKEARVLLINKTNPACNHSWELEMEREVQAVMTSVSESAP